MNATETVTSFLEEMLKWEKSHRDEEKNPLFKESNDFRIAASEKSRSALAEIFRKYVENGLDNKLTESRLDLLSTSRPSEFDQIVTTVLDQKKTTEVITRQKSGFEEFFRYTMKEISGEWKISKLFVSLDGVDWEKRRAL